METTRERGVEFFPKKKLSIVRKKLLTETATSTTKKNEGAERSLFLSLSLERQRNTLPSLFASLIDVSGK